VDSPSFEKLQKKIEAALEQFAEAQRDRKRLEAEVTSQQLENRSLKKRLEHAAEERSMLKKRLTKVMEHIDSLNL
jgi:chromosome segregation ATPase